jgi:phosphatidylglycerol---prolipoprotein diacylglyceryl transferase
VHPILFHVGALVIPAYGAVAALGVLLGLWLSLHIAPIVGVNPNHLWNLCILALFAAIAGSRLLLVILNWTILRSHPSWLLGLAMVHHPVLAGVGILLAAVVAVPYARWKRMPFRSTADALAAPAALALACEQIGALLAGAGYGTVTSVRWAVTYTHLLALRWSGAPLFVPVHPVQGYAALAFLFIAIGLVAVLPLRRQPGDIGGLWFVAVGTSIYFTEFFRDPEGRGSILHGALDGPQLVAVLFVIAGAFMLRTQADGQISTNSPTRHADAHSQVSHE